MKQMNGLAQDTSMDDEMVTIHFDDYGNTNLSRIFSVSEEFEKVINEYKLGELDGHMLATDGSDGFFFMYGPDARMLYENIKPILLRTPFLKKAEITLGLNGQNGTCQEEVIQLN